MARPSHAPPHTLPWQSDPYSSDKSDTLGALGRLKEPNPGVAIGNMMIGAPLPFGKCIPNDHHLGFVVTCTNSAQPT